MKLQMHLLGMLAAGLTLAAAPALGEEQASGDGGFLDKTLTWLTTDTYVGVRLGVASADVDEAELANSLTSAVNINAIAIDDGGLGYNIHFGKSFTKNLAVEVGFADLGDIDVEVDASATDTGAFLQQLADNAPVAPAGITIDAVGNWTFAEMGMESGGWADRLSLVGRLGLFSWSTEIEYSANGQTYSADDSGTGLHAGVGLAWKFDESLQGRFEFERYSADTDSDLISLGLQYDF